MNRLWLGILSSILVVNIASAQELPAKRNLPANNATTEKRTLPDAPSYTPLTPREKFKYFYREAYNPLTFLGAGITATSWHITGNPPYGGGMGGFGKSYAAALTQREIGMFLGRYAIPTILHQDPRYFSAPDSKPVLYRAAYAASRVALTYSDSGKTTWNASYILGGLASSFIAKGYIRDRDSTDILRDFAVGMGTDAGMNVLREFWPSLRVLVPGEKTKKIGDIVIGNRGLTEKPVEKQ